MARDISEIALGEFDPAAIALFLDLDGTLLELADNPDAVELLPAIRGALEHLHESLGGAVAIVTGRQVAVVDRILDPLHLPVAGVHGIVRRDAEGRIHEHTADRGSIETLHARLVQFAETQPGVLVEHKIDSVALHYRANPAAEAACRKAMDLAAADLADIRVMRGKMVLEAMLQGAHKGTGVAAFLSEPPFENRMPVYAGDDVTDEDAFGEVNARGGISIKVGEGETAAEYRVADTASFHLWLQQIAQRFGAKEHV